MNAVARYFRRRWAGLLTGTLMIGVLADAVGADWATIARGVGFYVGLDLFLNQFALEEAAEKAEAERKEGDA